MQRSKRVQALFHIQPILSEHRSSRDNFLAVKTVFQDEMPCPGFRSFAVKRHPTTRFKSHMDIHHLDERTIQMWIRQNAVFRSSLRGYPAVNCFIIRQLLGCEQFLDRCPIDENDLEHAKQLVDQFAFVPMEFLHQPNVRRLLQEKVPEYFHVLTQTRPRQCKHQFESHPVAPRSPARSTAVLRDVKTKNPS